MKHLLEYGIEPVDSHVNQKTDKSWSIKDKLLLGLTPGQYLGQALRNPFNWILAIILAVGLPLIAYRYFYGLGVVTHSSNDYPWGLFLGFGLFCMVPLSASGFMLGTAVEIFGRHDFEPIERLALLNGLLGYFLLSSTFWSISDNRGVSLTLCSYPSGQRRCCFWSPGMLLPTYRCKWLKFRLHSLNGLGG